MYKKIVISLGCIFLTVFSRLHGMEDHDNHEEPCNKKLKIAYAPEKKKKAKELFCPCRQTRAKKIGTFNIHIVNFHATGNEFSCPSCNRKFDTPTQTTYHLAEHGNFFILKRSLLWRTPLIPRFFCPCKETTIQSDIEFIKHIRKAHWVNKQYCCPYEAICSETFSTLKRTLQHLECLHKHFALDGSWIAEYKKNEHAALMNAAQEENFTLVEKLLQNTDYSLHVSHDCFDALYFVTQQSLNTLFENYFTSAKFFESTDKDTRPLEPGRTDTPEVSEDQNNNPENMFLSFFDELAIEKNNQTKID